jgi:hypothetical protein
MIYRLSSQPLTAYHLSREIGYHLNRNRLSSQPLPPIISTVRPAIISTVG